MTIQLDTTCPRELDDIADGAPTIFIGLIEWDSSMTPTIITGTDWYSVAHRAAHLLDENAFTSDWEFGEPVPLTQAICDDYAALMEWINEYHQQCTSPWFTFTGGRVGATLGGLA